MADEKTLRKIEEELLNAGFLRNSVQAVVQAFRVYDDAQESKRTFDLPDWMAFDKVVQEKDHLLYALQAVKKEKDDRITAQALEIKRLQAVKREKDDQLQAQALEIKRLQSHRAMARLVSKTSLTQAEREEYGLLLRAAKRWYESYMKNSMGQDLESCESRIRLAEVVCRITNGRI
jgi:hypothetical protein